MKNKYRILKIAITVILLGFLLSFSLKKFGAQKITDDKISVKMNEKTPVYFIDEKDIREMVKKENPSEKVGSMDVAEMEKKINTLPEVDSANVYLSLNGNLNLDIRQRVPVFRLNNNGRDFYVDEKGVEFPISKTYSHPCMLVMGNVQKSEYIKLAELVEKIDKDDFSKKYFIGISRDNDGDYNLLTSEGNYKVEIGDLENIDFKVKGFKTFVEKYLVYQDPQKYNKISVKYDNQIVTTLNPYFKENDSILNVRRKELEKNPDMMHKTRLAEKTLKKPEKKPEKEVIKKSVKTEKSKEKNKKQIKTQAKTAVKKKTAKPKAKIKVE